MIHLILSPIALDAPLVGNRLLNPVCFAVQGLIEAEQQQFSLYSQLIRLQTGIQLPARHLCPEQSSNVLLCTAYGHLLLNPVCILHRSKNFQKFFALEPLVQRLPALNICRKLCLMFSL